MAKATGNPIESVSVATQSSDDNAGMPPTLDLASDQGMAPKDTSSDNASREVADSPQPPSQDDIGNRSSIIQEEPTNINGPASEVTEDKIEADRREEVPALLGMNVSSEDENPENLNDQNAEVTTATDSSKNMSVKNIPDDESSDLNLDHNQLLPGKGSEPDNTTTENTALLSDIKNIQESLKDALSRAQYISSKIDAVSSDTECLIKQVNGISTKYELLSAELESITSSGNSKNMPSNTFLAIVSAVLVLLVVSQIYLSISLVKTQKSQHASSLVLGNMSSLNKKLVGHEKTVANQHDTSLQPEQVPSHAAAEKAGLETPANADLKPSNAIPVLEKLNKLRNGLAEKKLIRKETGDWFVYNKKIEECLSDIDVIEALNQAYKKSGRALPSSIPLPAHNALCVLKPDGKGGTEIVITQNFVP